MTIITESPEEPLRNDNSNPQQGTGNARPAPATPTEEFHDPVNHYRPTLTVPPTKKDSRKLFVGGLPADITIEEFRAFFEQFGEILDCVVMFDRETGRSRGFGFVIYKSEETANKLLSMGNDGNDRDYRTGHVEMRGKMVEIKAAEPKEPSGPRRLVSRTTRSSKPMMEPYSGYAPVPEFHQSAIPYGFYPPPYPYMAPVYYPPYEPKFPMVPASAEGYVMPTEMMGIVPPPMHPSYVSYPPPYPMMPQTGTAPEHVNAATENN